MQLRNKGFTLIEILAVIVIIGLLLLLITPSVINRLNAKKDDIKKTQNQIIEEITAVYMDSDKETYLNIINNVYCIPVSELIANGYIQDSFQDATDPSKTYNDKTVKVTIDENGVRNYEIVESTDCAPQNLKNIAFRIGPVSNENWSPYKYVEITFPNSAPEYEKQYKINDGEWVNATSNTHKTGNFTTDGTKVCAKIGNDGQEKCITVYKIDSEAPKCTITPDRDADYGSWYNKPVKITLTASDSGGSGLQSKGLTQSTQRTYNNTVSVNINSDSNSQYNGYVRDAAGNIGSCNIKVNVDATKPTCSLTTSCSSAGSNGWCKSDVKISFTETKDNLSQITNYGINKSTTASYGNATITQTEDIDSTTFYGHIKDAAGNTNHCTTTVKKDSQPPQFHTKLQWIANETYGAYFGWKIAENLSGLDSSSSIFEYCYSGHTSSSCGATCGSGNKWSHYPSTINPNDKAYFQYAHFSNAVDGSKSYDIYSGVSNGCIKGYSVWAYFKICDKAGNCSQRGSEQYAF